MQNVKTFLFLTSLLVIGFALWRAVLSNQAKRLVSARFGLVILLPGIGLLTPNIWLYYAIIVAAMLFLPRTRAEAVGLFILIALTLPLSSTTLTAGGTYLIKIDPMRLASLAMLPALRFAGGAPPQNKAGATTFDFVFVFFLLLQVALGARAGEATVTLILRTLLENSLAFAVPYFMLTRGIRDRADQRRLLTFFAMAGFLLSVVATFEMLRHWPMYQSIDTHLGTGNGLSKSLAIRGGMLRSPGPYQESTTFGVLLALTGIVTAALRPIFRSNVAHQFAILVGISGAFSTLARNGWVGLGIGLILLGVYKGRFARTAALSIVSIAAFSFLTIAAPKSGTVGALTGQTGHAEQTADYRERLLTVSIPVFKSSPWIGTSSAALGERLRADLRSRKLDVDFVNSYLYFALAGGGIGLAIFAVFTWMPLVRLWRGRPRSNSDASGAEMATAIFACLGAFSVMIFFTSFFERIPLFSIVLFGLARNAVLRRAASKAKRRIPEAPLLAMT